MSDFVSLGQAAARVVDGLLTSGRQGVERIPIRDRVSWLEMRKRDVTASQAAALLGVHEYITAYGLWALKSGLVFEDPEETPTLQRGRLLEPVAINLLREKYPAWTITQPNSYYRDPAKRIGCTPDAFIRDPLRKGFGILQIKTVEPGIFRKKWRDDDGTVVPPIWIASQAIVESDLTGASWAIVAPLRVGFGLEIDEIDVPLHANLIGRIESEVAAFWRSVESKQAPDPDYGRDAATIALLNQPDASLPPLDLSADNMLPNLVSEREALMARRNADDKRKKQIDAEITQKLAGHTIGLLNDGRQIVRAMQSRKEHVVKASTFAKITIRNPKDQAA